MDNSNELKIQSYWLRLEDDGTYSLEIETNAYTVNYPKVNVQFLMNHVIAFPVKIEALNSDDGVILNWGVPISEQEYKTIEDIPEESDVKE